MHGSVYVVSLHPGAKRGSIAARISFSLLPACKSCFKCSCTSIAVTPPSAGHELIAVQALATLILGWTALALPRLERCAHRVRPFLSRRRRHLAGGDLGIDV